MKKFVLPLLLFSTSALSGDIVNNGVITEVRNTGSNVDMFEIVVSNGTGPCSGKTIKFPRSDAVTKEVHDRAFSTALTAFASGSKVRVYNYRDDTCNHAVYISIRK
ncbi:DUF5992 family protein [Vibrio campbellii]|uniref:Uncharacterized protein n=1 Tax=Vibrio campbellii (strain ATCC BAA-1116) TaxID=2902295 RepID=A7MWB2_VIBC1|nr:hypothetical protein VIBHAR_01970 [Vibrio campbellii ATCC BAA-1116]AGU96167.1 hypothetical protein M892_03380 [Vibrio campbellii ATCC BAA-1116]